MPEILGESALYYRTGDAHDLAAKMTTILRMSNEDRTRFQELSKKTAGQFSWDETAVELLSRWKMRYVVSDT